MKKDNSIPDAINYNWQAIFRLLIKISMILFLPSEIFGQNLSQYRLKQEQIAALVPGGNFGELLITIDSTYRKLIETNSEDKELWEDYVLLRYRFYPDEFKYKPNHSRSLEDDGGGKWQKDFTNNKAWTKKIVDDALSHGVNLNKMLGLAYYLGTLEIQNVEEESPFITTATSKTSYNISFGIYKNLPQAEYHLEESKDTSYQTSSILGNMYYNMRRYKLSDLPLANRILSYPSSIIVESTNSMKAWAYTLKAKSFYDAGDYATMKLFGDSAESLGANMNVVIDKYYNLTHPRKKPATAEEWYNEADWYEHLGSGTRDTIIYCYKKVIALDWNGCKECSKAYQSLIMQFAYFDGNFEKTVAILKQQIADPRIPVTDKMYSLLGTTYKTKNQFQSALANFNLALSQQRQTLTPNQILGIYDEMSQCYKLLGNVQQATHYKKLASGY